jgi:glycosyl hydrolase family 16
LQHQSRARRWLSYLQLGASGAAIIVASAAALVDRGTTLAERTPETPMPNSTPVGVAEAPEAALATPDLQPFATPGPTPSAIPTMVADDTHAPHAPAAAGPAATAAPTAKPAPKPTAKPKAPPPPPPAAVGSCGAIPRDPAGWTRRVTSAFNERVNLGHWPGPVAARDWRNREAGYSDSSGRGTYHSGKTVTEHNGVLDIYVHSEGNTRYVAAPIARIGDTIGQRISLCMRADRIPGYKIAFLLWPADGDGNDRGEIDYPEGKLTSDAVGNAFMHYDPRPGGDPDKDAYSTGTSTANWHTYTIEWNPGSASSQTDDYTAFFFDGRLIGRSTGRLVPDGPMHYIMQVETYLGGQALPPPAAGHIYVDWVTISTP